MTFARSRMIFWRIRRRGISIPAPEGCAKSGWLLALAARASEEGLVIYFLFVHGKDEMDTLRPGQKRELKAVVSQIKDEWRRRRPDWK
jgi:hypothetical protein